MTSGYMQLTSLLKCMLCRVQIRPWRYRRDSDRGRPADLLEFLRAQRKAAAVAGEGGAGEVTDTSSGSWGNNLLSQIVDLIIIYGCATQGGKRGVCHGSARPHSAFSAPTNVLPRCASEVP